MSINAKTHILIVVIIVCAMSFAARFVQRFQSDEVIERRETGGVVDQTQYISISQASWGRNCDGQTASLTASEKIGITESGMDGTERYMVPENNALPLVAEKCAKQTACDLTATVNALGFDPAPGCNKELLVQYRCFSYDVTRTKRLTYRASGRLDCRTAPGAK